MFSGPMPSKRLLLASLPDLPALPALNARSDLQTVCRVFPFCSHSDLWITDSKGNSEYTPPSSSSCISRHVKPMTRWYLKKIYDL